MNIYCVSSHECLLFGPVEDREKFDAAAHLEHVVELFLNGAAPRATP